MFLSLSWLSSLTWFVRRESLLQRGMLVPIPIPYTWLKSLYHKARIRRAKHLVWRHDTYSIHILQSFQLGPAWCMNIRRFISTWSPLKASVYFQCKRNLVCVCWDCCMLWYKVWLVRTIGDLFKHYSWFKLKHQYRNMNVYCRIDYILILSFSSLESGRFKSQERLLHSLFLKLVKKKIFIKRMQG